MKKKFLALLLALCLILSLPAAPAAATEAEGVTWAVTDGLLTISGQGAMEDLAEGEAPWLGEEIYGIVIEDGVTHLGSNAFRGLEQVMDVTIGTGVQSMGESVFVDCPNLLHVAFLGSVGTIPTGSFTGCTSLSQFWFMGDMPVMEKHCLSTGAGWIDVYYDIDNDTWTDDHGNISSDGVGWGPYDIRRGESGTCGENVTWQIIYNEMLHADSDILLISGTGPMDDIPAGEAPWLPYCDRVYTLIVANGVSAIGANAFDGQHFSEIILAGSVREIGAEAFRGVTSLWALNNTPNIRYIGERAFAESSVGRVGYGGPMPETGAGVYESCEKLKIVNLEEGTTVIADRMFANCTALEEVDIPYTVTAIGDDAFAGCTGLETVNYNGTANQWEAIDMGSGNEALLEAEMEGMIETSGSCGDNAFWSFDDTTGTLTISGTGTTKDFVFHMTSRQPYWYPLEDQIVAAVVEEGITGLGDYTFACLEKLTSVTLPESLTELGDYTFYNCRTLPGVEFPEALTNPGKGTFSGCYALESFEVPRTITEIPEEMFNYCKNLVSVELHEDITSIGNSSFFMCEKLTDVELPENLTALGGNAFFNCKSLTHLEWPRRVTSIGGCTFQLSGLQEFEVPETVVSIGAYAFDGCSDLEKLTVTDSVCTLGEYAFRGTSKLTELHIPANIFTIPAGCFQDSGITAAEIPEGVTTIGRYAFSSCENLERVVLPESLTSIEDEVFKYCSSLREINWPSGVDTIGWHQFRGTALVEFTVPETVTEVGSYAFMDCPNLEKLSFMGKYTTVGGQALDNCPKLTVYCYYESNAQDAAEFQSIPYVLFDPPADLPRYNIYTTVYGDGAITAAPADSTGYEWITVEAAPGPDSALVGLTVYYYSDVELDLRFEQLSENSFRFLMPKCDVEIEAIFQNTITGFIDIKSTDFFYEPVLWAVEKGITTGTSEYTFSPGDACLRAQVVTFLWRAEGCPEPETTNNPFTDVKETDFYYKAVLWAVEKGITTGTSATTFSPMGVCNRAQVVTFLYRAKGGSVSGDEVNPFEDVPADSWYTEPVLWAVENGITNGLSATAFGPNADCNRAQIVTFLYRAYN